MPRIVDEVGRHRVGTTMSEKVRQVEYWSDRYQQGKDGWELKGPSPVIVEGVPAILEKHVSIKNVIVPGCGRGHDAHWLASQGNWDVVGLDFAPEAVAAARTLYETDLEVAQRLGYEQADVFAYAKDNPGRFDLWVDHTFLCAIDPKMRDRYMQAAANCTKMGGYFVGVIFATGKTSGPPWHCDPTEIADLAQPYFEVHSITKSEASVANRQGREWLLWGVRR